MALSKEVLVDKIDVYERGDISVRTVTRILENGMTIGESFHRHVVSPGDDVSNEDPKVKAVADALWTPSVIAAFAAAQQAPAAE